MRQVLIFLAVTGLILLAACTSVFPPAGKTPVQLAQELVDDLLEILDEPLPDPAASPTEFKQLILKFVYVPPVDRNNDEVIMTAAFLYYYWVHMNFLLPATVTEAKVLAASEHDVKLPILLNDPPNFIEKVYTLTLECETAGGSLTSVSLPMITVSGETETYFYTVFVRQTGSATEVWAYPITYWPSSW